MKQSKNNKLAKKEADRRNKEQEKNLGNFEMRPINPYEILKLKEPKAKKKSCLSG